MVLAVTVCVCCSYNNLLRPQQPIDLMRVCKEKLFVEISRRKLREEVLDRVKYVRTCVMARELCLLVRTKRAVLEPQDVQDICKYISGLCKEEGCTEPSALCQKAADAVGAQNEEKYLELCAQSCIKCGEAKRLQPKKDAYVA